jgi:hypothetical protein
MPTELSPRQAFDKLIAILNERKLTWVTEADLGVSGGMSVSRRYN